MNAAAVRSALPAIRPRRSTLLWGGGLVAVQLLFVLSYVAVVGRPLLDPFLVYPFVWIDVGLWALVRAEPPPASTRRRRIAAAIAIGYFLVLAVVVGLIGPGTALVGGPEGFRLVLYGAPPGWSPAVLYTGGLVHVALQPPYVIGYAALSYLVYVSILDTAGAAGAGALALLSCVSCTFPVIAAVVTGVTGASTGVVLATASTLNYGFATAVFLATVLLLYWRPTL